MIKFNYFIYDYTREYNTDLGLSALIRQHPDKKNFMILQIRPGDIEYAWHPYEDNNKFQDLRPITPQRYLERTTDQHNSKYTTLISQIIKDEFYQDVLEQPEY